jgi:hypothetical protein
MLLLPLVAHSPMKKQSMCHGLAINRNQSLASTITQKACPWLARFATDPRHLSHPHDNDDGAAIKLLIRWS